MVSGGQETLRATEGLNGRCSAKIPRDLSGIAMLTNTAISLLASTRVT